MGSSSQPWYKMLVLKNNRKQTGMVLFLVTKSCFNCTALSPVIDLICHAVFRENHIYKTKAYTVLF